MLIFKKYLVFALLSTSFAGLYSAAPQPAAAGFDGGLQAAMGLTHAAAHTGFGPQEGKEEKREIKGEKRKLEETEEAESEKIKRNKTDAKESTEHKNQPRTYLRCFRRLLGRLASSSSSSTAIGTTTAGEKDGKTQSAAPSIISLDSVPKLPTHLVRFPEYVRQHITKKHTVKAVEQSLSLLKTLKFIEEEFLQPKKLPSFGLMLDLHCNIMVKCSERWGVKYGCGIRSVDSRVGRKYIKNIFKPNATHQDICASMMAFCSEQEKVLLANFFEASITLTKMGVIQDPFDIVYPTLLSLEQQKLWGKFFHFGPPADQVHAQLITLFMQIKQMLKTHHPIHIAAFFNIEWTRIHPVPIGNGRTGHFGRNIILMIFGYPPVTCSAAGRSVDEFAQAIAQEIIQIQKDHADDLKSCVAA